MADNQKS